MKPLKLNMSKFHKIGGDEKHTIMRHQDGHEIRVSHKALSPEAAKQMMALPIAKKMADGGEVRDDLKPYMPSTQEEDSSGLPPGKDRAAYMAAKKKSQAEGGSAYADGGEVKKPSPSPSPPEIDKKKADEFVKGFNNPDPIVRAVKSAFGMADGGSVDSLDLSQNSSPADNSAPPQQMPVQPSQPVINVNVGGSSQVPGTAPNTQPPMSTPPAAAQPAAAQAPQGVIPSAPEGLAAQANAPVQAPQQADPYGTQAQSNALMQGIGLQRQGMAAQAQAQTKVAADEQKALNSQIQAQQSAQKIYQDHYNEISKHQDEVIQKMQDGQIDPNRFWNNKSTVGKIGTIIGMILGGGGAAMAGQENLAYNQLKRQVDADIDAQKANLGKQQTLLGAYNAKLGNLREATDMTRLMLNASAASQLQLAAAKQGGPIAQAMAAQNIGKLNAENAGIIGQLALRKSVLSGAQQGMIDPAKVVNFIVPESQRADANKELSEAQSLVRAKENTLSGFDALTKIATLSNTAMSPIQTSKQIAAIKEPIVAQLSKATAGRFTEQDAGMLDSIMPARGDNENTLAIKRVRLNNLLMEKMDPNNFPILKNYNILPSSLMRGPSQIQEAAPNTGIQESAPVVDPAASLRSIK